MSPSVCQRLASQLQIAGRALVIEGPPVYLDATESPDRIDPKLPCDTAALHRRFCACVCDVHRRSLFRRCLVRRINYMFASDINTIW